jgi:hypothetical protein
MSRVRTVLARFDTYAEAYAYMLTLSDAVGTYQIRRQSKGFVVVARTR